MDSEDVRPLRLEMRVSQWRLSRATGIPQSKISLYERGDIDLDDSDVNTILEALGSQSVTEKHEAGRA